jgi:lysophospholipase L1-like esterase
MTPFLFPTDEFFSKLLPIFDEFSIEYKKYLKNKKVEYIDLYEMLKPYSVLSNNRVTKDSVHPTPFGHGLIAQAVIDYLFK